MKKTVAILLIAVMALTFVACSAKSKLVGTWADGYGQSFTFKKDGTGTFTEYGMDYPLTYTVKGDKITIFSDGDEETFTFKISGKTLTLESYGETQTYTKK